MNILVTGCAGFIGSSLIDKLIENTGYKIIGVDNFDKLYSKAIKQDNMSKFINNKNFCFYESDITNISEINKIFEANHIDMVIHMAAKAGVRKSIENPSEYISVNICGTLNILNAMHKNNVKKIIFASSSSVYGDCKNEKFSEDILDLKPLSPYAQTKKTCEDFINLYTREYGISAVCLRFFTVFGKKQRPDLAIKKFENLIRNNKPIPVYGDGNTLRDYTYIDDIIDGIMSAMNYGKTSFEIINLGSGNPITLKDMINSLEQELGKKVDIDHLPMQKGDVYRTYADITKAQNLLGYSPKLSFKEALHKSLFD